MGPHHNSNKADTMGTAAPSRAKIRNIAIRDGTFFVSFEGMNSWYAVPAHLEAIIRKAADDRRPVSITTTTSAVVTAERRTLQEQDRC